MIDSTGLKIFGEGEWKVRMHSYSRRRTWRKLHLGINPSNHMIEASVITSSSCGDNEVFADLLAQVHVDLKAVYADGAYDTHDCYRQLAQRGSAACIPPRKNAEKKYQPTRQ